MRANPEVTAILRKIIRNQTDKSDMDLVNPDKTKRLYGVKLNSIVYFATLVELPCIIEAMKTLDNFNFYKSQDASQMLYVHPVKVDMETTSEEEFNKLIGEFDAIEKDPEFQNSLYDRLHNKPGDHKDFSDLKMRSGISPVAKNIVNIRFKQKPHFDPERVKKIEGVLKDLIDFGFAEHVDEQLLDFDE